MNYPEPSVRVSRWVHQSSRVFNAGTCFALWGGLVSAAHVYEGAERSIPGFARGPLDYAPGIIDAVLVGCTLPPERPRAPVGGYAARAGERVYVYGYPSASDNLSMRPAHVFLKRDSSTGQNYSMPTWIGTIDNRPTPLDPAQDVGAYYEPVGSGMSGGLVMAADGTALGILVTQNGMDDLDRDGRVDHSFDFVALADVWDVFSPTAGGQT